ncbi:hypothetical protein V6N11_014126 [Hibiscus sabdariffa]|uniref:Uncharacterized protein n=1 Tax=Hibiscus sabdariffa TaxID=183260 RepID=A0ABR2AFM9_9ROSI
MGHENEIRLVPLPAAIAVVEKRRCSRNVLARIVGCTLYTPLRVTVIWMKSKRPKTYLYWRFKRFDVIDVVVWRPTASDPAPDLTAGFSLLL